MIAVIPARGGSKGLPGKNLKLLCGKPLIAYSIIAAKESKYVDRIIVSTDSEEIAEVARQYGAEVPFIRPAELATDNAKAIDVYLYTVDRLNNEKWYSISDFIVLQPTSPLRTAEDIDNAIEIHKANQADSVISVQETNCPLEWYKEITADGLLKDCIESNRILNRQEYTKTYIPNGAIYVFKYKTLMETKNYYYGRTLPYIMSAATSIDIDTILDFKLAEIIVQNNEDYI